MTSSHLSLGRRRWHTYATYSACSAVAWAVIWIAVIAIDPRNTKQHVLWVFLGWLIGWISASIARLIYPPPPRGLLRGTRADGGGLQ